ncbi:putative spermidine/putrescine transport system substrate-binding protein [Phyllobacterium ifriqiyense]|uniref:Spermidine/putrescine transport system substrate-binding protein n=1 Tax=Phyllobacterium ifriqiyense TaxID=314238 RepID=A0ABU0S9V1_9HYPH|nr:putative spermidine/putrescine transport system substrate-binding protein [Phyllobacterium ifriqiyense]
MIRINRRQAIGGLAGIAGITAMPRFSFAQSLPLPSSPVALNIIDVAGNLQLTQAAIEKFAKENPALISKVIFSRAPSPELPAKLKAQQTANRVDIDLVLTGPGAMSDGITQGLWIDVWTKYPDLLPKADEIYHEKALMMQKNFGQNEGVAVVYSPSGPLFEYAPDRVKTVPKNAEELLAWVKANPGRFCYARPVNSGPGWTFLMAMPYILGDKNPSDPINGWEKTWAYLKELDQGIDYYPPGTTATMKEFAEGTRDMIVSTFGWDINPRVLGVVPKEAETFALDSTHWVPDTQFMCIPRGVGDDKVAVLLKLMSYMLEPAQQAYTYDKGYFYPGPAVKDVPLNMAPQESQDVIAEFGRPIYEDLIAKYPVEAPLKPQLLVAAFEKWDREVGANKMNK